MSQPPNPPYGSDPGPYGSDPSGYGAPPPPPVAQGAPGGYGTGYAAAPAGPFYVSVLGQQQGPLELAQLAQMASSGQLKGDAMVRSAESQQWFPAKQLPGLFSDKEWLTTLLLSVLVGSLGVDRFYLGYTGLGIAKLAISLVTCFTLGWIWAIIDIVLVAMRKLPDAQGRPLA